MSEDTGIRSTMNPNVSEGDMEEAQTESSAVGNDADTTDLMMHDRLEAIAQRRTITTDDSWALREKLERQGEEGEGTRSIGKNSKAEMTMRHSSKLAVIPPSPRFVTARGQWALGKKQAETATKSNNNTEAARLGVATSRVETGFRSAQTAESLKRARHREKRNASRLIKVDAATIAHQQHVIPKLPRKRKLRGCAPVAGGDGLVDDRSASIPGPDTDEDTHPVQTDEYNHPDDDTEPSLVGSTAASAEPTPPVGAISELEGDETEASLVGSIGSNMEPSVSEDEQAPSNTEDLVVATRVLDDEYNQYHRQEAEPVDLEALEGAVTSRKTLENGTIMTISCIALVLALTTGLVLALNKEGGLDPEEVLFTSSSPSAAPSSIMDALLEILPSDTQDRIQQDPFSPQSKAFDWLGGHWNITYLTDWRKAQLFALATFYYAFDGENWPYGWNKDWLDDQDHSRSECDWYSELFGFIDYSSGYSEKQDSVDHSPCNSLGQFQRLHISYLNLSRHGPTMPPEIALLTSLESIYLDSNQITSSLSGLIPKEIALLSNLTSFSLGNNFGIFGSIPSYLGSMAGLAKLTLRNNRISSSIPTELGMCTNLKFLELSRNKISGPIPTTIGQLTGMIELILSYNSLSNAIPTEIGLLKAIERFLLDDNNLSGPVHTHFGLMTSLSWLDLHKNNLSSQLVSELGMLTNMDYLDLGSNLFTGSIPSELGLLTSLDKLSLENNNLEGLFPPQLGLLDYLDLINVSNNKLEGFLPSELGLLKSGDHLLMSNNNFSGAIPSELGLAMFMVTLHLDQNKLSGSIPSELGLLSLMKELDLSSNSLTGAVPLEIGWMVSNESKGFYLGVFNVSGNSKLSGTIPEAFCFLESSSCSYSNWDWEVTGCSFDYDCSDLFCGCDCPCNS